MNELDLLTVEKRLRIYGIRMVKISEDIREPDWDSLMAEGYFPGICPSDTYCFGLDEIIDYCIDNDISVVYVRTMRFDYEKARRCLSQSYGVDMLLTEYEVAVDRISRIYPNLIDRDVDSLCTDVRRVYSGMFDELLRRLKSRTNTVEGYCFEAHNYNECMKWNSVLYQDNDYEKDFMERYDRAINELISRVENYAYMMREKKS